jgi:hypothetical protein
MTILYDLQRFDGPIESLNVALQDTAHSKEYCLFCG